MKTLKQFFVLIVIALVGLAVVGCKEDDPPPPQEQPIEKTYLAPNTKVTIKYMDLASNTNLPAEISKLAKCFTESASTYLTRDRTIYVIDGSSSGAEIQNDGTMKIGRKYVIDTPQDDLDDAIYDLRNSWLA